MKGKEQLSWFDLLEDEIETPDSIKMSVSEREASSARSYPSQLVADFERFIEYIGQHRVQATKARGQLARKALQAMDEQVSIPSEWATVHSDQIAYPYIDFLFHIAIHGHLIKKTNADGGPMRFELTDRVPLFEKLSHAEKYLFMLETFWVDVDWRGFHDESNESILHSVQDVFYYLLKASAVRSGQSVKGFKELESNALSELRNLGRFLLYFEWFGLWECETDEEAIEQYFLKHHYFAKALTVTGWGEQVIPILFQERNAQFWNIPLRQDYGEVNPIPGSPLERFIFMLPDEVEDVLLNINRELVVEPFIVPFRELCGLDDKANGLLREVETFTPGRYIFKVKLTNKVWRSLQLSGNHTMEQLHELILEAYDFYDDHLYSFFMDGKKWSRHSIVSPLDGEGMAVADKVRIGDLGFKEGQSMMYLFDYGDEWIFTVTVEKITEEASGTSEPARIVEAVGEAPEQYVDWGW